MNRQNNYQPINHSPAPQGRADFAPSNCRDEMKMLRALDFAIQETVLFLDAYPENKQALAYYHQLVEQRGQVMAAYQKKCGPVTMYGNVSRNSWDWVTGPWPWEPEAN